MLYGLSDQRLASSGHPTKVTKPDKVKAAVRVLPSTAHGKFTSNVADCSNGGNNSVGTGGTQDTSRYHTIEGPPPISEMPAIHTTRRSLTIPEYFSGSQRDQLSRSLVPPLSCSSPASGESSISQSDDHTTLQCNSEGHRQGVASSTSREWYHSPAAPMLGKRAVPPVVDTETPPLKKSLHATGIRPTFPTITQSRGQDKTFDIRNSVSDTPRVDGGIIQHATVVRAMASNSRHRGPADTPSVKNPDSRLPSRSGSDIQRSPILIPDNTPSAPALSLRDLAMHAASGIAEYVQQHGCADMHLRVKVLDLKTRLDESSQFVSVAGSSSVIRTVGEGDDDRKLLVIGDMIMEAGQAVIDHVVLYGCEDIHLKVMIMDLKVRLKLQ